MSTFQYAPSNPALCILLKSFHKFLVNPYYKPIVVHDTHCMGALYIYIGLIIYVCENYIVGVMSEVK